MIGFYNRRFVPVIPSSLPEVFLQTDSLLCDLFRRFSADISVVPGFENDSGDITFGLWVAENESILPGMLHQPFLRFCLRLCIIKILIVKITEVDGKPQFMFTGTRNRNGFTRFYFRFGSPPAARQASSMLTSSAKHLLSTDSPLGREDVVTSS